MIPSGRVIRVLLRAAAVGVLVCAAGTVGGSSTAGEPLREVAEPAAVDLYLLRGGAALVPGGAADRAMTVINHGGDMTGPVELYYTTPIFINLDEQKGLPPGCAMYYRNKDFHIPEIVKCTLSPLKAGQRHEVSFPIKIFDGAPAVPTYGTAIARPAKPDVDHERNIIDNIARPGGTISLPPVTPGGQAAASTQRAVDRPHVTALPTTPFVTDTPSTSDYRLHNHGGAPAENVRFIVVTPLYINTSTAGGLPSGCSMVLTDPDPAVPEIVECAIGTIEAGQATDIHLPVKAVPGGPTGERYGTTVVTTIPGIIHPQRHVTRSCDPSGRTQDSERQRRFDVRMGEVCAWSVLNDREG